MAASSGATAQERWPFSALPNPMRVSTPAAPQGLENQKAAGWQFSVTETINTSSSVRRILHIPTVFDRFNRPPFQSWNGVRSLPWNIVFTWTPAFEFKKKVFFLSTASLSPTSSALPTASVSFPGSRLLCHLIVGIPYLVSTILLGLIYRDRRRGKAICPGRLVFSFLLFQLRNFQNLKRKTNRLNYNQLTSTYRETGQYLCIHCSHQTTHHTVIRHIFILTFWV